MEGFINDSFLQQNGGGDKHLSNLPRNISVSWTSFISNGDLEKTRNGDGQFRKG